MAGLMIFLGMKSMACPYWSYWKMRLGISRKWFVTAGDLSYLSLLGFGLLLDPGIFFWDVDAHVHMSHTFPGGLTTAELKRRGCKVKLDGLTTCQRHFMVTKYHQQPSTTINIHHTTINNHTVIDNIYNT